VTPGEIVLVRFPFADLESAKKRPALVLAHIVRSPRNQLVTIAMITSQIEARRIDGDVELSHWQEAGLLHPSLLRLAKLATVDGDLVDKTIGKLSATDRNSGAKAFQGIFASWLR
jgi:mRNA interferase MazF